MINQRCGMWISCASLNPRPEADNIRSRNPLGLRVDEEISDDEGVFGYCDEGVKFVMSCAW